MSDSKLSTGWICIAAAGESVDGRVIEEQWIIDAAETYSTDLYTAMLWPEHLRDYGNMGEVLELTAAQDDEGVLCLYARLRPNIALIQANANGQLLFCSAEFTPDGNFRGTGKTYLEGLGVTDSPASVKTDRLHFSRRRNKKGARFGLYKPLALDGITKNKQDSKMAKGKKGWRNFFAIEDTTPEPVEEPSKDDALQALAQAVAALEDRVAALEARAKDTEETVEDVQDDVDTVKEIVDTENFARLVGNLPELVKGFSKLNEKITKLPEKKFSKKQHEKGFKFL